jgi:S-adenosylmethionine:tRNA ribosyltransferase-isomerase
MNDPRNISIDQYRYDLPEEKIAFYPLKERDSSKLLIYSNGKIEEDTYFNLSNHIPGDSLMVFNDTKVVEARILFQKETGGVIEIFCLEPSEKYGDISSAFAQTEKVNWHCLVGGASKWKHGQLLEKKIQHEGTTIILQARYIEKKSGSFLIELSWTPATKNFAEILHLAGSIPLPPYIKRAAEKTDNETYQTIYARTDGSVAAPTAGLHFTTHILESLKEKKIEWTDVTLHVGAGTFQPVKSPLMSGHEMHAEWIAVKKETIFSLLAHLDKKIVAVGTTSLRTIESLYWFGVLLKAGIGTDQVTTPYQNDKMEFLPSLGQWAPYELMHHRIPVKEALGILLDYLDKKNLDTFIAKTQLLIAPGYPFKIIEGLVTNFHQPGSTLLLLVAALVGADWKKIYDYALKNNFRFLSYGDGSLLWKNANV